MSPFRSLINPRKDKRARCDSFAVLSHQCQAPTRGHKNHNMDCCWFGLCALFVRVNRRFDLCCALRVAGCSSSFTFLDV